MDSPNREDLFVYNCARSALVDSMREALSGHPRLHVDPKLGKHFVDNCARSFLMESARKRL